MSTCQVCELEISDLEQQVADLSAERDLLLQQVTADLEELAFLRQVAELLTISEVTWDIADAAKDILPKLQYCVGAQQLVLIQRNDTRTESFADDTVLSTGQTVLGDADCRKFVERHLGAHASRPLVINNRATQREHDDFPSVKSFVLVPLVRTGKNFGWILAFNRDSSGHDAPGEPDDSKNLTEFGTRQATLLTSAASILATHASNVELFKAKEKLFTDLIRALVRAIEAKDRYTCGHSERVALYGLEIAKSLALPGHVCRRVYLAGLLHDVGKINIPESILRSPNRLSDEEFAEMKRHPDHGWGILHGLEGLHDVLNGVVYHHERWDGTGYPDGLQGEAIPLDSRILAVADAFDAMTSDRPYRTSMPLEKSLAIIEDGAGRQWDPKLVAVFLQILPAILQIRGKHEMRAPAVRQKLTIDQSAAIAGEDEPTTAIDGSLPTEPAIP